MLRPLTPPSRLAPLGQAGDDVCTEISLWDLGLDPRLAIQFDDIVVDECACTLPVEGQGEAFAIRCFEGDMRPKLWLVLFGDVDDPPELVCRPVGLEVTSWLCQGWGGDTEQDSEQDKPVRLHTGSFLKAWIPEERESGRCKIPKNIWTYFVTDSIL